MTISQRIFFELKNKGKKQKELAEYTGISTSAISAWNKNNTNPAAENLSTIADFLGVSLEYLITGKEKPDTNNLTENEKELLQHFQKLPDREQIKFIGRIEDAAAKYQEEGSSTSKIG